MLTTILASCIVFIISLLILSFSLRSFLFTIRDSNPTYTYNLSNFLVYVKLSLLLISMFLFGSLCVSAVNSLVSAALRGLA